MRIAIAVMCMMVALRSTVAAQGAPADTGIRSCADTTAPPSFGRTTIVQYWMAPNTIPAVSDQLDLVSQHVAERVRATLGAPPNRLPAADSVIGWRNVRGEVPLQLVIHRTQPTTWHTDSAVVPGEAKLVSVYLAALQSMSQDDLWVVWPEGFGADSIVMRFFLTPRQDMMEGRRSAFDVFSAITALLPETEPETDRLIVPQYPGDAKRKKIAGSVLLRFEIDTAGRVVPATITSVAPPPGAFDFPDGMRYYAEFVDAARAAALATTYRPARTGVCAVPQVVMAPYHFNPEL